MPQAESYLDWNATAALRPAAVAAMSEALGRWGNPSSVHRRGRAARQLIEHAREAVAALLGDADPSGVIFVSGGSQAHILSLFRADRERVRDSAIGHDFVPYVVPAAVIVPVDPEWLVNLPSVVRVPWPPLPPA